MLKQFWLGIKKEFSTISQIALNTILLFCTMYLCKVDSIDDKIKISINSEKHRWVYIPQHQTLIQNFIVYVKTSTPISSVRKLAFIFIECENYVC